MEANSTGGHGSRRAVASSDDDDDDDIGKFTRSAVTARHTTRQIKR